MPQLKFTVSDTEADAYKRASDGALLPLNDWMRYTLTAVAKDAVATSAQAAPAKRKVNARKLARFQETLAKIQGEIDDGFLKDVTAWTDRIANSKVATEEIKAYTREFAAWYAEQEG